MGLGVEGAGFAMFLTNVIIFMVQNYRISKIPEIKEATNVICTDSRITSNLWEYLQIAIPSFLFVIIEWSAHNLNTIIAGMIGTMAQDSQVIVFMLWLQTITPS
jgi:Na+-driven multidrug efflux pump